MHPNRMRDAIANRRRAESYLGKIVNTTDDRNGVVRNAVVKRNGVIELTVEAGEATFTTDSEHATIQRVQ